MDIGMTMTLAGVEMDYKGHQPGAKAVGGRLVNHNHERR
jgi:hypothetical protein